MNEEELAEAIRLAKEDPNVLEISLNPRAIRTTYSTRFFENVEEFEEAVRQRAAFGLEQVERSTFGVQINRAVTDAEAEESSRKGKGKSKYALKKERQRRELQTQLQKTPRRAFGLEPPTEMPLAASLEEDRSVRPNRDERFPSAERARGTNPEYTHRRVHVSHLGINP